MPSPDNIVNGDFPNADRLMEWFNYITGITIMTDTFANLKAAATVGAAHIYYATDLQQLFFYNGDDPASDESHWMILGGFGK